LARDWPKEVKKMIASQLMHRDIVTIRPTASIRAAAKKMKKKHADMVVVLEDDGRFKGVLTEKEVSMATKNLGNVGQAANDSAKRKDVMDLSCDDGNRCNYFSEVAIDLLMSR
jgi:signal-transduction protein with cAMP-binding, CBS, and nucleotidyltransferase domain